MAARRPHDDPELFAEALRVTVEKTGYAARLIEKDYFCTLLLEDLAADESLVFKGGTCLAKVHAGFYRLSEDLDFSIPLASDASRKHRSRTAERFKKSLGTLPDRLPVFRLVQPCQGANNSSQYTAVAGYRSCVTERDETIKIGAARAAAGVQPRSAELIEFVRQKLAVSGREAVDVSPARLAILRQQLEAELQPVLRAVDFQQFDLDRAFAIVSALAAKLQ